MNTSRWFNSNICMLRKFLQCKFFGNKIRGRDLVRISQISWDLFIFVWWWYILTLWVFWKSNQGARSREISRISWDFLPRWESEMQKRRLARLSFLPLPDPTPGVATEFQIILTFRFHHHFPCSPLSSLTQRLEFSYTVISYSEGWSYVRLYVAHSDLRHCTVVWHSHHWITSWCCTVSGGFIQWFVVQELSFIHTV